MGASFDERLATDLSRFYADPLGFVIFAYPWSRDPSLQLVKLVEPWKSRFSTEYGPEAWACELFDYIGAQVRLHGFDGKTAVEPIRVATTSGHGITKSATVAQLIDWIMSTRPYAKGIVTASTLPQLATKTWPELAKWTNRCITKHWFEITSGLHSMKMVRKGAEEEWRVDAQTSKEENSESFAGLHAASSTPFYIFDEASGVPDKIEEVSEGGMTDGEPMKFAFGNPTQNTGWFRECFRSRAHRWKTYQIDSRKVQITNKVFLQQMIDDYGIGSDRVKVRILGQFPSSSAKQFIGDDLIAGARKREARCDLSDPLVMGVDVGRGGDPSCIVARKGRDSRTIPPIFLDTRNTMELVARVQAEYIRLRPDAVFVDGGGVGGGVVDRLRELRVPVIEIQFGGKADGALLVAGEHYADKGSEMWGCMREWLKGGAIPDEDMTLEVTGREEDAVMREGVECIKLESKDSMRARGLSSPNWGDALALTFAYPVLKRQDGRAGGVHQIGPVGRQDYDPLAPPPVQPGGGRVQSDYDPFG